MKSCLAKILNEFTCLHCLVCTTSDIYSLFNLHVWFWYHVSIPIWMWTTWFILISYHYFQKVRLLSRLDCYIIYMSLILFMVIIMLQKIIPFREIIAVRKAKTAGIFPNAIEICDGEKKVVLSFLRFAFSFFFNFEFHLPLLGVSLISFMFLVFLSLFFLKLNMPIYNLITLYFVS